MIIAVKFPIKAIGKKKPEKNQGFNGIRTRDLRDTGAMLYQLSYEATHWERGQFIEFIWALSIGPKIPEIPGLGANGTDIFRNFIPKFWVYLARLA